MVMVTTAKKVEKTDFTRSYNRMELCGYNKKQRDTPHGVSLQLYSNKLLLAQSKCYVHSASNCTTYHWVVTNTEEAHHLNVCRY